MSRYLFGWQRRYAVAVARQEPSLGGPLATGLLAHLAVDASGTTGENLSVDAEKIALAFGVTPRTIHRAVASLVAGGWLCCTSLAKRPTGRGRRDGAKARYCLLTPETYVSAPCGCDTRSHDHRVTRSVRESAGTCDTPTLTDVPVLHKNITPRPHLRLVPPSIDMRLGCVMGL